MTTGRRIAPKSCMKTLFRVSMPAAVILATHGAPAVIPSETLLTFKLSAPVSIAKR
jgi:hypothetical protein